MSEPEKKRSASGASRSPGDFEQVGVLTRISDGKTFTLGFGSLRVGRQRRADLVITDKTVSRHHADVIYESGRYVLYDHSTNGTWVNGNLVAVAQPLRDRDTVKFGTTLKIDWIAANSPGKFYKGAAALTERVAGITFLNRHYPLAADTLFFLSLAAPSVFSGFEGTLDASGTAIGAVHVPNVPPLAGIPFSLAFVTVDASAPFGIEAISGAWQVMIAK